MLSRMVTRSLWLPFRQTWQAYKCLIRLLYSYFSGKFYKQNREGELAISRMILIIFLGMDNQ